MEKLKIVNLYDETDQSKIDSFINNTRSDLSINTNLHKVETNFEWLDIMEDTIRYLDNILRNPNRFIINEEEIVKVELARRITVESIRHLSKHTNYIQDIDKNGDVKPSKILNINKDESYDTYENRLIYTLINNMSTFLEVKKKSLITSSSNKDTKKAKYNARTKVGNEQVFIELNYTSTLNEKVEPSGDTPIEDRIQRLDDDIKMLTSTEVYKALKKMHVAKVIPPIKKTNVILKNTNFQYAMKLWDFLQANVADDAKVIKENKNYEEDGILKEYLNSTFLLDYLAMNTLSETKSKGLSQAVVEDLTDKLVQRIVELNVNMPISELKEKIGDKIAITRYKREVSISEISNTFSKHIKSYLEKIENMNLGDINENTIESN